MTEHLHTPAELEELAVLDAWGLLSGEELAQFESAFASCDASQRAHLRSVQETSSADLANWGPAPAELRERVLRRVQATIDLADLRLASFNTLRPSRATSVFSSNWTWRLAALVLLAVSVTLVVMHQATNDQYDKLLSEHTVLQALRTIETDLGTDEQASFIAMMRRPDVRHAYVTADQGGGFVRLAVDENTGEAFVLALDLAGQLSPCTLELEDAQGNVIVLASLRTDRNIDAQRLRLDPKLLDGATLRLRSGDGGVIGTSLA